MGNVSQQKRRAMLEFLARWEAALTDDEARGKLREIAGALDCKKFGLVWEEHRERADEELEQGIPVFQPVPERELVREPGGPCHFLLEGDNLHSLSLLQKTHRERVDLIYIDPPYNRGKDDFVYDDNYVEAEDSFRHSKWLSFMEKRLRLAYDLLAADGILFMSIDDKEQAPLKLLADEIFGEQNFVITLPRVTKRSGKTTGSFSKNHDYVLVYTKGNGAVFAMEEHTDPEFRYEDEYVAQRGRYKLNQTLDYDSLSYSASLDYPLELEGETFYPGSDAEKYRERPVTLALFKNATETLAELEEVKQLRKGEFDSLKTEVREGSLTLLGRNKLARTGFPGNVLYYRVGFVPRGAEEGAEAALFAHTLPLIWLEQGRKTGAETVLLASDEEADAFFADPERVAACRALYVSARVLLTAKQEETLEQTGLPVFAVPDRYFEAELRKEGER